eukprot:jgi/Undpi1/7647/HiC_scaffold_23.g10120.m1
MAMWKGNQRNRTVSFWVDGVLTTTVETSADTLEYEAYPLSANQASTIVLQDAGGDPLAWLSITGVQLMTDYDADVSSPGVVPTSGDYVGCYNDLVGDRILTTVFTDDALTPAICEAACAESSKYYYGLQQGNECWCAGCDITELETNTDYDRHGEGSCSTPCSGDSTSTCGGDFAAALEITATWVNSYGLGLHVIEPGGTEVNDYNTLGDVGHYSNVRDGYEFDDPGSETYLSLNGLNVDDDAVLGDYVVWGEAREGTIWSITARSGGELLWIAGGVIAEFESATDRYTATVSSYAESDCTIDTYALVGFQLPETVSDAIIADAVGGFVGPGRAELYDGEEFYKFIVTEGAESGTISVSGNFEKYDDTALPDSTGLYLYLYNEDSPTDFERGQGVIDGASGNFSATIDDIPVGYSRGVFSFVALDANDGGDLTAGNSVNDIDIANEGCSDELRIKLEWNSNDDIDLWVTDPNGNRVSYADRATDIGYINDRNGGGWTDGNPDTGYDSSYEEYVLFSGLSGDDMIGDYNVFARRDYAPSANDWTLTVTMNGEVVSIETGSFPGSSTTWSYDDDDFSSSSSSSSRRQLFTDDYTYDSYYYTSYPQSDTFVVTLGSYDPVGC